MNLERYSPRAFLPPSTRMGERNAAMKTEQILRQWKDAGYVVPLIEEDAPRFALWDLADGIADFFRREGNALFAESNEIEATMQAQLIAGVLAKLSREGLMQDFKKALDEKNDRECRRLMVFAYRNEAKDFSDMELSDAFSPSAGFKADIPYRLRMGRPLGSSERNVREKMALLEKIKTVRLTKGGKIVIGNAAELASRIQIGEDLKAAIFAEEQSWPEQLDDPENLKKFLASLRATFYRAHQEPLMYPQFSEEFDRARAVGCLLIQQSLSNSLAPGTDEEAQDAKRVGCRLLEVLRHEFSAAERPSGLKGVRKIEDLSPRLLLEDAPAGQNPSFEACFVRRLMEYAEAGWQIPESLLDEASRAPLVHAFMETWHSHPEWIGASYAADSAVAAAAKLSEAGLLKEAMTMADFGGYQTLPTLIFIAARRSDANPEALPFLSLDENPNVWINFAHEEAPLNALPDVLTHPAYDAWLEAQKVVMIDAAAVFLDGPHVEEMTGKDLAARILLAWSPEEYDNPGIASEMLNSVANASAQIDWQRYEPGRNGMPLEVLGPELLKAMRIAVSQGGMGLPIFMNSPHERERALAIADRLEEIGEARIAAELREVSSRMAPMHFNEQKKKRVGHGRSTP